MEWRSQAPASAYLAFDAVLAKAFAQIPDEPMLQMDIAIALKEVFSNIREHTYKLDLSLPIYLSVNVTDRYVLAVVMDSGARWRSDGTLDREGCSEALLQLLLAGAERGRGLLIMANCTDYTKYLRGGCTCVMRWNRWHRDNGGNGKATP